MEVRNSKKISQQQIAEQLNMAVSCYSKRENGQVYMRIEEWEKLAKILEVPLSEIYESDDRQIFICNDNTSHNFLGTNNSTNTIYPVPKELLETQQKYIAVLEEKIDKLTQLLDRKEN